MVARDSILLIVKQNSGISYQKILKKIRPNYGTINSCRAALSRSLKELSSYGYIQKNQDNYYIIENGRKKIYSEMRSKLILRINNLMECSDKVQQADAIVKNLTALIERSKQDNDLLKIARDSTDFQLKELTQLSEDVKKKAMHLDYLSGIIANQINSLKELGFNDFILAEENENTIQLIMGLAEKTNAKFLSIESNNREFLAFLESETGGKIERNILNISITQLEKALNAIQSNADVKTGAIIISLLLPTITVKYTYPKIYFFGPANELERLLPEFKPVK